MKRRCITCRVWLMKVSMLCLLLWWNRFTSSPRSVPLSQLLHVPQNPRRAPLFSCQLVSFLVSFGQAFLNISPASWSEYVPCMIKSKTSQLNFLSGIWNCVVNWERASTQVYPFFVVSGDYKAFLRVTWGLAEALVSEISTLVGF